MVHDPFLIAVAGEFVLRFIDKLVYLRPLMWSGTLAIKVLTHTSIKD